jgi:hypothetical protein
LAWVVQISRQFPGGSRRRIGERFQVVGIYRQPCGGKDGVVEPRPEEADAFDDAASGRTSSRVANHPESA